MMHKKVLLLIFTLLLVLTLGACGKTQSSKLSYNELEPVEVEHTLIRFPRFEILGETESYRMAKNSLKATVSKEEKDVKTVDARTETNSETNKVTYKLTISGLEPGVSYKISLHASINQEKVVIKTFELTTLLEGGSAEKPYLISTKEDFYKIREKGTGFFALENDIDFGGQTIELQFLEGTYSRTFSGTFDGKGHKLANFELPQGFGIFGRLGNGKIQNLVIENAKYSSFNDSDSGETTRNFGILNTSVSQYGLVENITFKDCKIEVQVQSENRSKVGLVAGQNFGTIRNIEIINSQVSGLNIRNGEFDLGLVVGEATTASSSSRSPLIEKVSIDELSSVNFYNRDAKDVQTSIGEAVRIGSVAGKVKGELKEIYSLAQVNVIDHVPEGKVYVLVEGIGATITSEEDYGKKAGYYPQGADISISIADLPGHELDQVLVNGEDKKVEVVDGILNITPSQTTHVIVTRKVVDETTKLKLEGEGYEVVVPEGEEVPKEFTFGDTVTLKFKQKTRVLVNEIMVELTDDLTYQFAIKKDTKISVSKNSSRDYDKTYYIGGIAGEALIVENAYFGGKIKADRINRKYREFSKLVINGITSTNDVSVMSRVGVNAEITVENKVNMYPVSIHSVTLGYNPEVIKNVSVVGTPIKLNDAVLDDGLARDSELNKEIFESEFILSKFQ